MVLDCFFIRQFVNGVRRTFEFNFLCSCFSYNKFVFYAKITVRLNNRIFSYLSSMCTDYAKTVPTLKKKKRKRYAGSTRNWFA